MHVWPVKYGVTIDTFTIDSIYFFPHGITKGTLATSSVPLVSLPMGFQLLTLKTHTLGCPTIMSSS